ncbi:MAG: hypothetical protein Q4E62_08725 [Sutterellaceae bacterium]|nr:hypothetical protein [Sutterellaceae bacterium]
MVERAKLQKLGTSTVVAFPQTFLEKLHWSCGTEVELRLKQNAIEVRAKKKLSLDDRLAMYKDALTSRTQTEVDRDRQWLRAPAVGREL